MYGLKKTKNALVLKGTSALAVPPWIRPAGKSAAPHWFL